MGFPPAPARWAAFVLAIVAASPPALAGGGGVGDASSTEWEVLARYLGEGTAAGFWEQQARQAQFEAADEVEILLGGGFLGLGGSSPVSMDAARDARIVAPFGFVPCWHEDCRNAIVSTHVRWHLEHEAQRDVLHLFQRMPGEPHPEEDPYGEEWLGYHRRIVREYDAWRAEHGVAPIVAWAPGTAYPPNFEAPPGMPDRRPAAETERARLPTWATIAGGTEPDPVYGHASLDRFETANQLGKALDFAWHHDVHEAAGGLMFDVGPSAQDPLFWAFHKFIDEGVFTPWEQLSTRLRLNASDVLLPFRDGSAAQLRGNLDRVEGSFRSAVLGDDA